MQQCPACRSPSLRERYPFDAVSALHVLEHFPDPYVFLEAVRANLKPGGYFLVEVPNYMSLQRRALGRRWRCFVPFHALHLSPRSLRALLQRAGFEVVHLETVGCGTSALTRRAVDFVGRRLGWPPRPSREPTGLAVSLATKVERRLGWGVNVRAVARRLVSRD